MTRHRGSGRITPRLRGMLGPAVSHQDERILSSSPLGMTDDDAENCERVLRRIEYAARMQHCEICRRIFYGFELCPVCCPLRRLKCFVLVPTVRHHVARIVERGLTALVPYDHLHDFKEDFRQGEARRMSREHGVKCHALWKGVRRERSKLHGRRRKTRERLRDSRERLRDSRGGGRAATEQ